MPILFRKTKELEAQIDNFLDLVLTGGLLFKQGIGHYLAGRLEECNESIHQIDKVESEADSLRRNIESSLYAQTLIPESRGDVLGLLESSDRVLNRAEEILARFTIENPYFPPEVHDLLAALAGSSSDAVEAMVSALRAYFHDPTRVRDHSAKVAFYEHEADDAGEAIDRAVFASEMELAGKLHIRYFVQRVQSISDRAEDVCDRLSIAVIKRND